MTQTATGLRTCSHLRAGTTRTYVERLGGVERICLDCAAVLYRWNPNWCPRYLHIYLQVTEAREQKGARG